MGDFEGLEIIDGMMAFKESHEEPIICDKCGRPFFTKNKYRFYCEDCYLIIRMQEDIKTRDWGDRLVKKQWREEAKATRLAIIAKYGKPCPPNGCLDDSCQQSNNESIVE